MQDLQTQPIAFREIRNIPETLNATFDYVRQNFRSFRKGMLLYILPSFIVAQFLFQFIGAGFLLSSLQRLSGSGYAPLYDVGLSTGDPSLDLLLSLLAIVSYLIGITILIAFVHAFVIVGERRSRDGESQGGEVPLEEVWQETRDLFGKVLGTNIGLVMLGFVASLFLIIISGLFIGLIPVLGVLIGIAMLLTLPVLAVTYALYYPVRFIEGQGFSDSFSRAWQLITGRWWRTCGLLIICWMLSFTLSSVSSLPMVLLNLLLSLDVISEYELLDPSSPWGLTRSILTALFGVVAQLFMAFPLLSIAFYYYSQVERLDSRGLQADVERIGTGMDSSGEGGKSASF